MCRHQQPAQLTASHLPPLSFHLSSSQVHLIIERAAPTNVWQEACAAGSGGIAPMQLRRAAAFDRLAAEACAAAGGRLPPRSRLPADSLVPLIEQAPAGLPGSMHAVGTALAVVAIGALAIQH